MAAGVRCSYFFGWGEYAWSETHWWIGSNTIDDAVDDAKALAKARAKLLGRGATLNYIRLSIDGVFRDSKLIAPNGDAGTAVNTGGAGNTLGMADETVDTPDAADTCLLLRAESGTLRRKSIFLGGLPDTEITGGKGLGVYVPDADFVKRIQAFIAILINKKWGFRGRTLTPGVVPVNHIVINGAPPSYAGVQVSAGTGNYAIGDAVQLRGFKLNQASAHRINGQYHVQSKVAGAGGADDTYYLYGSVGIDPATVLKTGTVEKVEFDYLGYTTVQVLRPGRRKRGGRTGLPLGRQRTRK